MVSSTAATVFAGIGAWSAGTLLELRLQMSIADTDGRSSTAPSEDHLVRPRHGSERSYAKQLQSALAYGADQTARLRWMMQIPYRPHADKVPKKSLPWSS
eukprot:gnl/TRDRNA2_/TRDRNA2_72918_c0_seq1.p2 gnl/TRDRNA2_/TRDRNA2_72918_c0~~gnl/TRDRNA2_/TRDRNA2_72918_c0_seq1.p2  ORF type:complete len:100 (+),score=11.99 gnl/TRDRNA2_/TRDRNA2_72918_c0_seq1:146-445(+)